MWHGNSNSLNFLFSEKKNLCKDFFKGSIVRIGTLNPNYSNNKISGYHEVQYFKLRREIKIKN